MEDCRFNRKKDSKKKIEWFSVERDGYPEDNLRLLTYSEIYAEDLTRAYRVVDSTFLRKMEEVTHFIILTPPKSRSLPKEKIAFSKKIKQYLKNKETAQFLYKNTTTSVSQIARHIGVSAATASNMIDNKDPQYVCKYLKEKLEER